jgi:hypothetical protein
MRVRSQKLFAFLEQQGVLEGSEEQISEAKKRFRKLYHKEWRARRQKKKGLRPIFTPEEYDAVRSHSKRIGMRPYSYAREVILHSLSGNQVINKTPLLKVLQLIGMTGIALSKAEHPVSGYVISESINQLFQAEQILLSLLNHNDS